MKPVFTFTRGDTPLLLSVPHAGTRVSAAILQRFTNHARDLPDTDWFVDRLYDWVTEAGAGMLVANLSRYVIDLNRSPDDAPLYSGATTSLVPLKSFDGQSLYAADQQPDMTETGLRCEEFWRPYHDKLATELERLRQRFGYVILLDAHSIRSRVPMLFEGRLPDLNLGSFRGASADPSLISASFSALRDHPEMSSVLDGRFQGGYITRHYGRPHEGVHALQLEMAQSVYMQECPPVYDAGRASNVVPVLNSLIQTMLSWVPQSA